MKPKPNQVVTVVDKETGEETTGRITKYSPDEIRLEVPVVFDTKKVEFKEE